MPSVHRLGRGLPGYLIPFATHAFVPQRQKCPSKLPSQLVFLVISTDVTPPPQVLFTSDILYFDSIFTTFLVEPKNLSEN
jgi:hypothetical protein